MRTQPLKETFVRDLRKGDLVYLPMLSPLRDAIDYITLWEITMDPIPTHVTADSNLYFEYVEVGGKSLCSNQLSPNTKVARLEELHIASSQCVDLRTQNSVQVVRFQTPYYLEIVMRVKGSSFDVVLTPDEASELGLRLLCASRKKEIKIA